MRWGGIFDIDAKLIEITNEEEKTFAPNFWNNPKEAEAIVQNLRSKKKWVEDFVDEDTGEVVSIERNEVIIERDTILEASHIDEIVEAGVKTIILNKEEEGKNDDTLIEVLRDLANFNLFWSVIPVSRCKMFGNCYLIVAVMILRCGKPCSKF